jgi:hypothetical protein
MTPGDDLAGWTPIRARPDGEDLVVEWRWLDDAPFREPFFAETVQLALERPFSLLFPRPTNIDELGALEPGLEPNGLILHMSRCGSTLVSQMLAAVPEHLVLSEPLLVNDVLRAPAPDEERIRRLRLAVSALGRLRSGRERGYVLKLDPWATHDLPLIRRAFPDTPWLFLSRDPLEVLVSHRRQPGYQMLPSVVSPALVGLDLLDAVSMPFEDYGAHVLGAICRDALASRDERALFVDYRELPDAVFDRVLDLFGLDCSRAERALMEAAARRDAKVPSRSFAPDGEEKARAATPELRAAVDRRARPAYDALGFSELSSGSGRSRTAR